LALGADREALRSRRFAVAGLGVSGIAAARALQRLGADATAFDQKPSDHPAVVKATDELMKFDVPVVSGWHGRLNTADFDVLVVSPGFRRDHPAINDMASKDVWGEIELAYHIAKAPIIAITGTNGKSTTTVLTWELLRAAGCKARLCGNIAGSGYPEEVLTDAAFAAGENEILVAEISSYQLEFADTFTPQVAAITNITPDHMDRHPNFQDYWHTKMHLVGNMGQGTTVVLNGDGQTVTDQQVLDRSKPGVRVISFSPGGQNQGSGVTSRSATTINLGGHNLEIRDLNLPGEHSITNVMMAWEMAATIADPGEAGIQRLKEFAGLENRLEFLGERDGVKVYNNSMCTNPAAVINSTMALTQQDGQTVRQHLIMGGNTKELDFTPVGEYLSTQQHQVYLFGNRQNSLNLMLGGRWHEYNSLEEAFAAATEAATSGEAIVLSPGCSSSEPFSNFKERGTAFKNIAKDWLINGYKTRT
jgi:UDP-N-acetylmuramoylalanine--D-glutamate ligase